MRVLRGLLLSAEGFAVHPAAARSIAGALRPAPAAIQQVKGQQVKASRGICTDLRQACNVHVAGARPMAVQEQRGEREVVIRSTAAEGSGERRGRCGD